MEPYGRVWGKVDLLRQAHQEHVGPLGEPLVVQLLLGSRALHIVRRLQAAQQVGEGGVHVLRERRHAAEVGAIHSTQVQVRREEGLAGLALALDSGAAGAWGAWQSAWGRGNGREGKGRTADVCGSSKKLFGARCLWERGVEIWTEDCFGPATGGGIASVATTKNAGLLEQGPTTVAHTHLPILAQPLEPPARHCGHWSRDAVGTRAMGRLQTCRDDPAPGNRLSRERVTAR